MRNFKELEKRLCEIHTSLCRFLNLRLKPPKVKEKDLPSNMFGFYDYSSKTILYQPNLEKICKNILKEKESINFYLDFLLAEEDAHYIHHTLNPEYKQMASPLYPTPILKLTDKTSLKDIFRQNEKLGFILWSEGLAKSLALRVVCNLHSRDYKIIWNFALDKLAEMQVDYFSNLYKVAIKYFINLSPSEYRNFLRLKTSQIKKILKVH